MKRVVLVIPTLGQTARIVFKVFVCTVLSAVAGPVAAAFLVGTDKPDVFGAVTALGIAFNAIILYETFMPEIRLRIRLPFSARRRLIEKEREEEEKERKSLIGRTGVAR